MFTQLELIKKGKIMEQKNSGGPLGNISRRDALIDDLVIEMVKETFGRINDDTPLNDVMDALLLIPGVAVTIADRTILDSGK